MNFLSRSRVSFQRFQLSKFSSTSTNPCLFSKIAVLGGGNMAEAILAAIKGSKAQDMSKVVVVDINMKRLQFLNTKYGVSISEDANEATAGAELMVC